MSKGNSNALRLRKEDMRPRKIEAVYIEGIGVVWSQIPGALPVGQEAAYARPGWLGKFTAGTGRKAGCCPCSYLPLLLARGRRRRSTPSRSS